MPLSRILKRSVCFLAAWISLSVHSSSITLEWDPNTEIDLSGYKLYASSSSLIGVSTKTASLDPFVTRLQFGTSTQISTATAVMVSLPVGTTMYYRLTAFDTWYNESGFNVNASTQEAEVVVFLKNGDINGDGKIDAGDVIQVINMILGNIPVDLAADFNGDNLVTVVDVSSLINIALTSP